MGQTLYYDIVAGNVHVVYPSYPWNNYTQPTGNLTIPSTVTHENTTYTVTAISNHALYGCHGLTSVTIPGSVAVIGRDAFGHCTNLSEVNMMPGVQMIDSNAFAGCSSLTEITIPATVTTISLTAFDWINSWNGALARIIMMSAVPPTILTYGWGSGSEILPTINIPCGALSAYQTAWAALQVNFIEPSIDLNITLAVNDTTRGSATVIEQNNVQVACADSSTIIFAEPFQGYYFDHWSNNSTANPDTLHLTGDSTVTAFFLLNHYTVTAQPNDTALGTVLGSGTYNYLDNVQLTAICTAEHHHFVQWADGVRTASRTITVTQDSVLTAIFAIDTLHVNALTTNADQGHVIGSGDYPYGAAVEIEATANEGYHFAMWSDGSQENPYIFTLESDTTIRAIFTDNVEPQICMVSVQNGRNTIMWNKELEVSAYNIYREGNTSGTYDLVATLPYTASPQWTDSLSRPNTRSYRYRMTASDIFGIESEPSAIHKTMHLTISQGIGNMWNLVWTEYEGADYTTYVIYRGTTAADIHQIDIMPAGGNTTYTDENAPSGNVYYQVGVLMTNPCNNESSTSAKAATISRSNIATNGPTEGITDVTIDGISIHSYGNRLYIDGEPSQPVNAYDLTGREVAVLNHTSHSVSLPAGVYIVRVGSAKPRKVVVL